MTKTDSNDSQSISFFVGCYTQKEGHAPNGCGEGIYCCSLGRKTGAITLNYTTANTLDKRLPVHNPSYLHFDKERKELYVVEEVCTAQQMNRVAPRILAYSVLADSDDKDDIFLKPASEAEAPLVANCFITRHKDQLLIASYGAGSILCYPIVSAQENAASKNSIPFFHSDVEQYSYQGSGPNANRQEASHAHHIAISPDERWMYVCDLGSDVIWCHSASKDISSNDPAQIKTPPGSGPRHLVFHPNKSKVYVVSELSGHLLVYNYDRHDGRLTLQASIKTYPSSFKGVPSGAGICMHPSGKAVYVANRNHDSVAVIALDESGDVIQDATSKHSKKSKQGIQWVSCGGKCPRDIAIDPSGKWLLVGNQDSDTIAVCRILSPQNVDEDSQELYSMKTPTCIAFAR